MKSVRANFSKQECLDFSGILCGTTERVQVLGYWASSSYSVKRKMWSFCKKGKKGESGGGRAVGISWIYEP